MINDYLLAHGLTPVELGSSSASDTTARSHRDNHSRSIWVTFDDDLGQERTQVESRDHVITEYNNHLEFIGWATVDIPADEGPPQEPAAAIAQPQMEWNPFG